MTLLSSLVFQTYFYLTIAASSLCFLAYGWDKFQAKYGSRRNRVPEATLHPLEIVGGWPGALVAQRCFRHKSRKSAYQTNFRIVVVIHVMMSLLLFWMFLL